MEGESSGGMNSPTIAYAADGGGESVSAVARERGRNWAWSQGPPTQTAVARGVRMRCESNRWVVLAERGYGGDVIIPFEGSPQSRAEKLARVVADRVASWGLAIGRGYWRPILEVEVAADAGWRYEQLTQLLDGSGLAVRPVPSSIR